MQFEKVVKRLEQLLIPFKCADQWASKSGHKLPRHFQPDLPLEIWLEIFRFATYVPKSATIAPLDPFTPGYIHSNAMGSNTPVLSMRTKCTLVLVCKSWRNSAVQLLYEYITISSPWRANIILSVLLNDDGNDRPLRDNDYGKWTRHIEVYTHARGSKSLPYLQTLFRIFQCCPNLRMLSGTWNYLLPIEFLKGISKMYGSSLQGLLWDEIKTPSNYTLATPEFITSFQSLRILDLRNFVGGDLSDRSKTLLTLPYVHELTLSTHPHGFSLANSLVLPSLRRFTFEIHNPANFDHGLLSTFLEVHGPSITSVDLLSPEAEPDSPVFTRHMSRLIDPTIFLQPNMCPNLNTIVFSQGAPLIESLVSPHPSLRRIGLRGVKAAYLHPSPKHPRLLPHSNTKAHLMSFTPKLFPRLEVVRTIGFMVDADTDGYVKDTMVLVTDLMVWWAEKFEKDGIDFQDGEGVLWLADWDEEEEGAKGQLNEETQEKNKVLKETDERHDQQRGGKDKKFDMKVLPNEAVKMG